MRAAPPRRRSPSSALPCAMEKDPVWKLVPLFEFEVLQPLVPV